MIEFLIINHEWMQFVFDIIIIALLLDVILGDKYHGR